MKFKPPFFLLGLAGLQKRSKGVMKMLLFNPGSLLDRAQTRRTGSGEMFWQCIMQDFKSS